LLAAAALDRLHDVRPVFAGIAVLLAVPILLYLSTPLPAPPRHAAHGAVGVERRLWPSIILLAAIAFLYLGAEVGFGGWVFTYVRTTSHAATDVASWAPAGYWLALSAGSVGAALRPRRVRLERLVLACGLGCVVAALLFVGVAGAWAQVVLATLLGLCLGPIYPLTVAEAARLAPHAAGKVSGVVLASSQVGGSVLPWLQGRLLAEGALWGAGLTITACAALTVLQFIFIRGYHAAGQA
jgi:fucose permease